jgi:hypothetical protein
MLRRRITTGEEQDVHTSWEKAAFPSLGGTLWNGPERGGTVTLQDQKQSL